MAITTNYTVRTGFIRSGIYLILIIVALTMLVPFVWMLS